MSEEQKKIIPSKIERTFNGVAIQCAPCGEFNKDGKIITFPNRLKVGNGFKTIADLKSIDQINAIVKAMNVPAVRDWVEKNLPQSTSDVESEVDEQVNHHDDHFESLYKTMVL